MFPHRKRTVPFAKIEHMTQYELSVDCSSQATGKLKAVTTVKTPMTLPADATFGDYLAAVVEPDQVTEVQIRDQRACMGADDAACQAESKLICGGRAGEEQTAKVSGHLQHSVFNPASVSATAGSCVQVLAACNAAGADRPAQHGRLRLWRRRQGQAQRLRAVRRHAGTGGGRQVKTPVDGITAHS